MTEQQPKPEKALSSFDIKFMSVFLSLAVVLTSVVSYFGSQSNGQDANTAKIEDNAKAIEAVRMSVDEVKSTHKARAEIDKFHDRTFEVHGKAIQKNTNDIHTRTFK